MTDFWNQRNVFVTGANGFVGSWLTKKLVENGSNIVALIKDPKMMSAFSSSSETPSKIKTVNGDIVDYNFVQKIFNSYEIDTCFHLAAQAIVGVANKSPIPTFETNIKGTWNILEASRNANVERIVVASSDKAYGNQEHLPYTEESPLNGLHPYDASKACADILARTYSKTYALPVSITRCANIFGGGDMNFSRIFPDTIRSILNDKNPIIRTDGTPIRQYIYVKDVVNTYLLLAEKTHEKNVIGEAFNFGSSNPISALDLVKKIIEISGKTNLKPTITGERKAGEIDKQYLSSEKAKKILGWKPEFSLEDGTKETISWYKEEFDKGNQLLKI